MGSKDKSKRKNKEKKRLRWILLRVVFLAIVGASLWGIWEYTKPENFPIKNVRIFATYDHVKKDSLQHAVSSYLSNGFFYLNVGGLKKRLLGFPWIYAVSVKREWPDTVLISIVEEKAMLQWGEDALVNHFGAIFSPEKSTFPKELPIIFGPKKHRAKIFDIFQKAEILVEPLDLRIKKMSLNSRHYWEILLSNDVMVYLKKEAPLDQMELLASLYRKITADRDYPPKSFDLRYQSGLAVKW